MDGKVVVSLLPLCTGALFDDVVKRLQWATSADKTIG